MFRKDLKTHLRNFSLAEEALVGGFITLLEITLIPCWLFWIFL